ncbi:hypothetical protein HMI56_000141 [Coelomomyces lativittatus]|nr:hypothetical protein HMI56_000141 [Coelomomyces lativittatus]
MDKSNRHSPFELTTTTTNNTTTTHKLSSHHCSSSLLKKHTIKVKSYPQPNTSSTSASTSVSISFSPTSILILNASNLGHFTYTPDGYTSILNWIENSLSKFNQIVVIACEPWLPDTVSILLLAESNQIATIQNIETSTVHDDPPGQISSCLQITLIQPLLTTLVSNHCNINPSDQEINLKSTTSSPSSHLEVPRPSTQAPLTFAEHITRSLKLS